MDRESADPPAAAGPTSGHASLDMSPLPGLIGYALRRAHAAVFARYRRHFADLDIRPVQLGILTVVANNPGLKQADVSAALGIQRANLVPLLAELAARDLVERARAEGDRRSHALALTPAGAVLLAECQAREAALERELAATIGPEGRERLLALLRRIETASLAAPDPEP